MRLLPTLTTIWDLRRHPSRRVRAALWVGLFCVVGLLTAPHWFRQPLLYAWYGVNGALALICLGWGIAHPRAVLRHRRITRRWAFWLTLIQMPLLYSFLSSVVAEIGFSLSLLYTLLGTLLNLLVFYLFYCLLGFLGQCTTAFFTRGWGDRADAAAREGLAAWWLCYVIGFLGLALSNLFNSLHPVSLFFGLSLGLPLYTWAVCTVAGSPQTDLETALRGRLGRLGRWLSVVRLPRGRVTDLRGTALGLFWATIVLVLSESGMLALPQGVGLVTLVQLYNIEPGITAALNTQDDAVQETRDRIVLLDFDPAARRAALTDRSEAAVQANLIDLLHRWGAACIVLPYPPWEGGESGGLRTPDAAEPTRRNMQRSRADLPRLLTAMRRAGSVVLALPTRFMLSSRLFGFHPERFPESLPPDERALFGNRGAALPERAIGRADLTQFGTSQLPALRTGIDWSGFELPSAYPPVPIVIAAMLNGAAPTIRRNPAHPSDVEIAGVRMPLAILGKVLIDFHSDRFGQDFRRVDVSSVLNRDAQYVRPLTRPLLSLLGYRRAYRHSKKSVTEEAWIAPDRFFRGKVVFLDTLTPQLHDTPVGLKPGQEVLAYATATLLAGQAPRPVSSTFFVPLLLLLGMLAGHLSLRRPPVDAGWRIAALAGLLFALSLALFLFSGARLWLDPTSPALAMVAAYLQVTQFAFAQERHERERNRDLLQRFVAPQVVEELLDDPEGKLGLGGSRRRLCVLFADVRGFTPFTEGHSPEEVIEVMNSYLTALTDALYLYEGILDKYTGDGLLALFPVGNEASDIQKDVTRAVQGALAMRDAAIEVSRQRVAQGLQPLNMGFALHYGEAVVGLVGNLRRFEYTALGYTVVVCARLQTLAGGEELVVSEAVAEIVQSEFPFEPGEPVHVKGIAQPIRPYRIAPPPHTLLPPDLPQEAVVRER